MLRAAVRRGLDERIAALIADFRRLGRDPGFNQLIAGMSRLRGYSAWNKWAIVVQRPDATAVAGRRQWERLGRQVRTGERPVSIIARFRGLERFGTVEVFDIAQTDGPPPPARATPVATERTAALVEAAAPTLGLEVTTRPLADVRRGEVLRGEARPPNLILVAPGQTPGERVETLVHEYAHALLHFFSDEPPPGVHFGHAQREAEAQATAHAVLGELGIACGGPTYIAWQGGTVADVRRSVLRIAEAAEQILAAIDGVPPGRAIPPPWQRRRPRRRSRVGAKSVIR